MVLSELQTGVIANLIFAAIAYAAGVVTSGKIKPFVSRIIAVVTNKEVQISVERRDIFDSTDNDIDLSRFASSIFHDIREKYEGNVTDPNVNGRELTLSVDGIPNRVSIKMDEERGIQSSSVSEEVTGYRLAISPEGDLRFGYRSTGSIEEFEKFANKVENIVQTNFFPGTPPHESNVDATIKKGVPAVSGKIEDKELEISAHLDGSVLRMTMRDPNNLVRGVKRFLSPN